MTTLRGVLHAFSGYIAAYSKRGGRRHFSVPWWSNLLLFTAPRFRSELKMAACYTKELALFIVCLHYEPTVELGTEKMRDAQNAPSGLHLDLIQLWSILTVWLSSLCRQHSRHILLVCLHTILVSITINLYRGKLTNISLIIGFLRSKSYLKTSWPWLKESIPARVGFFPFRRAKWTSMTKIIKTTCNIHARAKCNTLFGTFLYCHYSMEDLNIQFFPSFLTWVWSLRIQLMENSPSFDFSSGPKLSWKSSKKREFVLMVAFWLPSPADDLDCLLSFAD